MLNLAESQAGKEAKAELDAMRAEREQEEHDRRVQPYREAQERQADEWNRNQQTQAQQRQIADLQARAERGDRTAADWLANHRAAQAIATQGRQAVLQELGADISKVVSGLDISSDMKAKLMMAPDLGAFARELRKAPVAVQREVKKSMQDLAGQTAAELGYSGPAWQW